VPDACGHGQQPLGDAGTDPAGVRDCYDRDAEIRVPWFQGNAAEFVNGSERMGAYVFELRGYTINQQLPGDDGPGQVAALYQDALTWAGLEPPGPAGHEGTGNVQHR